jgi:hypothetical protein
MEQTGLATPILLSLDQAVLPAQKLEAQQTV